MVTDILDSLFLPLDKSDFVVVARALRINALLRQANAIPGLYCLQIVGSVHEVRGISYLRQFMRFDPGDAQAIFNGAPRIADFILVARQAFFLYRRNDDTISYQRSRRIVTVVDAEDVGGT